MANLINKVTVKNVYGDKSEILKAAQSGKGKPVKIMDIVGIVTKATPVETDKGTSVKFQGNFEGINAETGECFQAGVCYLPNVVENILDAQMAGEDVYTVQFGFAISVKENKESVVGYEYTAAPLIKQEETDPLNALKSQAGLLQLENKSKTKAA